MLGNPKPKDSHFSPFSKIDYAEKMTKEIKSRNAKIKKKYAQFYENKERVKFQV